MRKIGEILTRIKRDRKERCYKIVIAQYADRWNTDKKKPDIFLQDCGFQKGLRDPLPQPLPRPLKPRLKFDGGRGGPPPLGG